MIIQQHRKGENMTKPNLVKMLEQEGHLPNGLARVVHHRHHPTHPHPECPQEVFRQVVFDTIAEHYHRLYPKVAMTTARHYAVLNFSGVVDEMWKSYQQGHHQLRDYLEALHNSPVDVKGEPI